MKNVRACIIREQFEDSDLLEYQSALKAWEFDRAALEGAMKWADEAERWQWDMNEKRKEWMRREEERGRLGYKIKGFVKSIFGGDKEKEDDR
jgi:hypothetical protein